jgi:3-methyl-2-oxobutanoate hydroxymethyltransferase
MVRDLKPKFVKRFAELGDAVVTATRQYVDEVRSGAFPTSEQSFGMAGPRAEGEPTGTRPAISTAPPPYGPTED